MVTAVKGGEFKGKPQASSSFKSTVRVVCRDDVMLPGRWSQRALDVVAWARKHYAPLLKSAHTVRRHVTSSARRTARADVAAGSGVLLTPVAVRACVLCVAPSRRLRGQVWGGAR